VVYVGEKERIDSGMEGEREMKEEGKERIYECEIGGKKER
jgi:hypothetical protein